MPEAYFFYLLSIFLGIQKKAPTKRRAGSGLGRLMFYL
jgi:hypothetical protein